MRAYRGSRGIVPPIFKSQQCEWLFSNNNNNIIIIIIIINKKSVEKKSRRQGNHIVEPTSTN